MINIINKANQTLKNKRVFIILLILLTLILRSHTFFNDYYDRDELGQMVFAVHAEQSNELFFGPYGSSINVTYNVTLKIFGQYNWRALHLLAIIIILLTALAAYFTVKNTMREEKAALYSAFFYSVFASIGYKDIYPLTAELIFNLYIAYSFLFLTYALFSPSKIYFKVGAALISLVFFFFIFHSKMHAKFHLFIIIAAIPLIQKNKKSRYWSILAILLFIAVLFPLIAFIKPGILSSINSMLSESRAYIFAEKLSAGFILYRISTTSLILCIGQFPLWYFAFKYFKMKKDVRFSREHYVLIAFFIINFVPALLTLRFFPHYFIQPLLPASILAGIYFYHRLQVNTDIIKPFSRYLLGITLVVIVASFSFVTLRAAKPDLRAKVQMFWPNAHLVDVINWLNNNNVSGKKIFVWGDAAEIYYFTKTSSAGVPLWLSIFARDYLERKKNITLEINSDYLFSLISTIEKEKMPYVIDTQPNGYSDFERFPLKEFTELHHYILQKYRKVAELNKIVVYQRIIAND